MFFLFYFILIAIQTVPIRQISTLFGIHWSLLNCMNEIKEGIFMLLFLVCWDVWKLIWKWTLFFLLLLYVQVLIQFKFRYDWLVKWLKEWKCFWRFSLLLNFLIQTLFYGMSSKAIHTTLIMILTTAKYSIIYNLRFVLLSNLLLCC